VRVYVRARGAKSPSTFQEEDADERRKRLRPSPVSQVGRPDPCMRPLHALSTLAIMSPSYPTNHYNFYFDCRLSSFNSLGSPFGLGHGVAGTEIHE
jgi:hypothetical protein